LGKGTVQKKAINELTALSEDNSLRANALELLYNLRVILETNQNLDAEDRELIMELSPLYLERLDEATQQGIQQGESIVVENLLKIRFGVLDEELQSIVAPLLELAPEEFTLLLLQLSRDELLARFSR
jgi:hypothetical protein